MVKLHSGRERHLWIEVAIGVVRDRNVQTASIAAEWADELVARYQARCDAADEEDDE